MVGGNKHTYTHTDTNTHTNTHTRMREKQVFLLGFSLKFPRFSRNSKDRLNTLESRIIVPPPDS